MAAAFVPALDAENAVDEKHVAKRDVPLSVMARYGVGQIGAQIFRDTPATLLPIFLTTMLGVPAWIAGISILLPKLWVIFCDPLMGAFSDRKKTLWGRSPFLLAGSVLTTIGFVLLFTPPDFPSFWMYAAYNTIMFTIASTAFSMFSVPYLAMASEMTGDYHERTKILAFRMVFISVGLVIGVGCVQPLILWFGGGRHGYVLMAATLGALCFITMMTTYLGLRRFPLIPTVSERTSVFAQFRMAAKYRPFAVVAGANFLQQLGLSCSYTVVGLMFIYAIGNIVLLVPFVLIMSIFSILSQALWLWVSQRIGKLQTYVLAVVVWGLVTLTWFLVRPGADVLISLPILGPLSTKDALVLLRAAFIGVFNSGFVLMSYSLLTDTVEFDRRRFGISREGALSGIYSALEKLAFALGPAVAGIVMSATGFAESRGGPGLQSAGAIHGIVIVYGFIPAAFAAVSLLLLRLYKLDEKQILAAGPA
jgi:GPH family glycoside/pentoside/hexuronide:cation symporter